MQLPAPVHERRGRPDRRRIDPHPISAELAHALATGEVSTLFQPQFCAADDRLLGAEVLSRWQHPVHGNLPGDALVAIAQSGGIVRQLTRHIARAALCEAAHWPEDLRLSLNVTAMDLFDPGFAGEMLEMLDESGLSPARLTLEITEQALVADLERSARKLAVLAERGIDIALDDFGAGFCNFRYLKVLPLDALKLDRSMVDGIAEDPRDLAVLRGIMAMARALGLKVVAEGVETSAQHAVVREEGCQAWQGFYGARAMSPARFAAFAASTH